MATKKKAPSKPKSKSTAKPRASTRKVVAKRTTESIEDLQRVTFLVVVFTALSIVFAGMSVWRFW